MTGETSGGRQPDVAGFVIAAGLLALALIIAWDSGKLGAASTYSPVGPSAAAYAVAAGLAASVSHRLAAGAPPSDSEPFDLAPGF